MHYFIEQQFYSEDNELLILIGKLIRTKHWMILDDTINGYYKAEQTTNEMNEQLETKLPEIRPALAHVKICSLMTMSSGFGAPPPALRCRCESNTKILRCLLNQLSLKKMILIFWGRTHESSHTTTTTTKNQSGHIPTYHIPPKGRQYKHSESTWLITTLRSDIPNSEHCLLSFRISRTGTQEQIKWRTLLLIFHSI